MIKDDNIREMIKLYIKNGDVSTKELNSLKFNSGDLTRMKNEMGIIQSNGRGHYKVDSNLLLKHSIKLYNIGDLEEAYNVLYRVYLDNKDNLLVVYNLFLYSILQNKYETVFECLDILSNNDSDFYSEADINFYIYLLGVSKNLPEKYVPFMKCIKFTDVRSKTGDQDSDNYHNMIRSSAVNNLFPKAYSLVSKTSNDIGDKVIIFLLKKIMEIQKNEREDLLNFINSKDYEGFIDYLTDLGEYRNLSILEEKILSVASDIVQVDINNVLPVVKDINVDSKSPFMAIDNKDYRLAIKLQSEYNKKNNISNESNIMYLLLRDICYVMDEFNRKKKSKEDDKLIKQIDDVLNPFKTQIDDKLIENILSMLVTLNIEGACLLVDSYLSNIDKKEYSYLIKYLIKISVLEEDNSFSKPMMALSMMSNGSFKFVISEYILSFYECLARKKFEEARVYLDIIMKSKELGQSELIVNGMEKVLENAKNESDKLGRRGYDYVSSDKIYSFEDLKTGYTLEQLKDRGIVLCDFNKEDKERVLEIVNHLPNVEMFVVSDANKKKYVFRYKECSNLSQQEDFIRILQSAINEFSLGNDEKALEFYKSYLSVTPVLNSSLFARIGLLSMKLFRKDMALDYFIVAETLRNFENIDFKYLSIIKNIREDLTGEEIKCDSEVVEEVKGINDGETDKGIVKSLVQN